MEIMQKILDTLNDIKKFKQKIHSLSDSALSSVIDNVHRYREQFIGKEEFVKILINRSKNKNICLKLALTMDMVDEVGKILEDKEIKSYNGCLLVAIKYSYSNGEHFKYILDNTTSIKDVIPYLMYADYRDYPYFEYYIIFIMEQIHRFDIEGILYNSMCICRYTNKEDKQRLFEYIYKNTKDYSGCLREYLKRPNVFRSFSFNFLFKRTTNFEGCLDNLIANHEFVYEETMESAKLLAPLTKEFTKTLGYMAWVYEPHDPIFTNAMDSVELFTPAVEFLFMWDSKNPAIKILIERLGPYEKISAQSCVLAMSNDCDEDVLCSVAKRVIGVQLDVSKDKHNKLNVAHTTNVYEICKDPQWVKKYSRFIEALKDCNPDVKRYFELKQEMDRLHEKISLEYKEKRVAIEHCGDKSEPFHAV